MENPGSSIKKWANVILAIGIILSFIIGILIMLLQPFGYGFYSDNAVSSGLRVFIGFVVIIVGSLQSWLLSLLLYSYGDMTENIAAIRKHMELAPSTTESPSVSTMNSVSLKPASKTEAPSYVTAPIKKGISTDESQDMHTHRGEHVAVARNMLSIKCPLCGTIQPSNNEKCVFCDVIFDDQ